MHARRLAVQPLLHAPGLRLAFESGYEAMLLTAVMVTSIFSVSLTARSGALRNDRRIKCQQASKQLSTQL